MKPIIVTITAIIGLIAIIIGGYLAKVTLRYLNSKDYNYKSKSDTTLEQKISKKQKMIVTLIPIGVALLWAILYQIQSDKRLYNFIIFGCISVIINLMFTVIMAYLKRDEFIKELGGYLVATFSILTLIIPFFSYYFMASLICSGFKIPFAFQ